MAYPCNAPRVRPAAVARRSCQRSVANPHAAVRSAHEAIGPATVAPVVVGIGRCVIVEVRRPEAIGDERAAMMPAGMLPVSATLPVAAAACREIAAGWRPAAGRSPAHADRTRG